MNRFRHHLLFVVATPLLSVPALAQDYRYPNAGEPPRQYVQQPAQVQPPPQFQQQPAAPCNYCGTGDRVRFVDGRPIRN